MEKKRDGAVPAGTLSKGETKAPQKMYPSMSVGSRSCGVTSMLGISPVTAIHSWGAEHPIVGLTKKKKKINWTERPPKSKGLAEKRVERQRVPADSPFSPKDSRNPLSIPRKMERKLNKRVPAKGHHKKNCEPSY